MLQVSGRQTAKANNEPCNNSLIVFNLIYILKKKIAHKFSKILHYKEIHCKYINFMPTSQQAFLSLSLFTVIFSNYILGTYYFLHRYFKGMKKYQSKKLSE